MTNIIAADVIDISKWQYDRETVPQRKIDFALLASKVKAVFCKCGQGNFLDYAFEMYMRELKAHGVHRGSYWFYDNRFGAKVQAQKYSEFLDRYGLDHDLPAFIDFEVDYPAGKPSTLDDVYNFITEFQRLNPGKEIGIYTGFYFWTASAQYSGMKPGSSSLAWFEQFPLWLAWYTHDNTKDYLVCIPEPWDEWMLWQFTDRGDGFGHGLHSRELDLNKTSPSTALWLKIWSDDVFPPSTEKRKIIFPNGKEYQEV